MEMEHKKHTVDYAIVTSLSSHLPRFEQVVSQMIEHHFELSNIQSGIKRGKGKDITHGFKWVEVITDIIFYFILFGFINCLLSCNQKFI